MELSNCVRVILFTFLLFATRNVHGQRRKFDLSLFRAYHVTANVEIIIFFIAETKIEQYQLQDVTKWQISALLWILRAPLMRVETTGVF